MKSASVAHIPVKADLQVLRRVPRGWIILGSALLAWLVAIGLIAAGVRLFEILAALL
jgi:hypothetical protein